MDEYAEGKEFTAVTIPVRGTYENCIFRKCNWLEADLSRFILIDCEFDQCDLTMCKVSNTTFNGVVFKESKLTGVRFDHADQHLFDVIFRECILRLTSFYQRNLKEMEFIKCDLGEADFTESQLTDAVFENCNLIDAVFINCDLRKTDFSTAEHVSLDLTENKLQGAKFRIDQLPGLVRSFGIELTG